MTVSNILRNKSINTDMKNTTYFYSDNRLPNL